MKKGRYIHKQVKIRVNGKYIQCDKKIAEVVRTLNKVGCITQLSCQDNNGKVWFCFTLAGARHFWKMAHGLWYKTDDGKMENWMYDQDWQYININNDWGRVVEELVSLRFPKEELSKFKKYLRTLEG